MFNNVLDFLNRSLVRFPNKIGFVDENKSLTYNDFKQLSDSIAMGIINNFHENKCSNKKPIVVILNKSVDVLAAFYGIISSGNFYAPLDINSPIDRLKKIIEILNPALIITDDFFLDNARSLIDRKKILLIKDQFSNQIDKIKLENISKNIIDTDLLYVMFTSGSTGFPKGVTISHRAVIDYTKWASEVFDLGPNDIYGNQGPFYFDISIHDIYCTIRNGSTLHIIPQKYFMFPIKIMDYLNKHQVNSIFWIPSALIQVANSKILNTKPPHFLKKVLFCGEVMPTKQLNIWRENVKDATYINLYGPTEATEASTYYIINRDFLENESLPIGRPFHNTNVLVLNKKNHLITPETPHYTGELFIRGSSLSYGYYNNPRKTSEVFIQNPLHDNYQEIVYKTGDLVEYNKDGELLYLGREDHQIKHMGYRIELGEIETIINSIDGVDTACAIYDSNRKRIIMFYTSDLLEPFDVATKIKGLLHHYMIPRPFIKKDKIPLNANGKYDRIKLMEEIPYI